MLLIFALVGLFVQIIFLFKREWLFEKKSFSIIAVISAVMFVFSYSMAFNKIGNPDIWSLLSIPLIAVIVFYFIKVAFLKLYGRNLEDTFWSMDASLMGDGLFNAIFWILGTAGATIVAFSIQP